MTKEFGSTLNGLFAYMAVNSVKTETGTRNGKKILGHVGATDNKDAHEQFAKMLGDVKYFMTKIDFDCSKAI